MLDGVKKKLDEASNKIEETSVRSRALGRKLREVEALPAGEAQKLLGDISAEASGEDDSADNR